MTIRILVVDDHPVVLSGLLSALNDRDEVTVVGQAGDVEAALALLRDRPVDVGLVDIRLTSGTGLDLIQAAEYLPQTPAWIVLSSFETPQYIVAALDLGASGYLLKTAPLERVIDAILRVAAGGTAFEARHLQAANRARRQRLTPREREVVARVVAGRSNDEISADLGVARKTIEAYLTRLFERFEVGSRTELALKAEREGWLGLPGRRG